MLIPLIITLLVAVAVALVLFKSRTAGTGYVSSAQIGRFWRQRTEYPQRDHRPAVERSDFSAVSIQCGPQSCRAARRLEGRRGLSQPDTATAVVTMRCRILQLQLRAT